MIASKHLHSRIFGTSWRILLGILLVLPIPAAAQNPYEDDDTANTANWIGLDATVDQTHNFHDLGRAV